MELMVDAWRGMSTGSSRLLGLVAGILGTLYPKAALP